MDQNKRIHKAAAKEVELTEEVVSEATGTSEHYTCVPLALLHPRLRELILKHDSRYVHADTISLADLETLHRKWLAELFEVEHEEIEGKSTDPDDAKHPDLPDTGADFGYQSNVGERIADKVAKFGGSWKFIGLFGVFLVLWMAANILLFHNSGWDPYPFILLNLCLSCIAALQAPVIMMSQNRQEQRERLRAEYDFEINLRSEIALRSLHQKVDRILAHQWERLEDISQRLQERG